MQGEIAIVDPTGLGRAGIAGCRRSGGDQARRVEEARRVLAAAPGRDTSGSAAAPEQCRHRPLSRPLRPDPAARGSWNRRQRPTCGSARKGVADAGRPGQPRRLALVVVHPDAVVPPPGDDDYGTYDLYVPANFDDRIENGGPRELARSDRRRPGQGARRWTAKAIEALMRVDRVQSVTVTADGERRTVARLQPLLPFVFEDAGVSGS